MTDRSSSSPAGRDLRAAATGPLALRLSPRYLEEYCILPLGEDADGSVTVAIGAPLDVTVQDELARVFHRPLRLLDVPAAEIRAAILGARRDLAMLEGANGAESGGESLVVADGGEAPVSDLRAQANEAPVITIVNVMVLDALRVGASDVHIESLPDGLRVRYRLDGVLHDVSRPPREHAAAVVSRIKIMAGMNIAERRLPQDGRIRLRTGAREVDLRVSTLPALHGESVVLRILDQGSRARELAELGMPDGVRERFTRLVHRASGIVLVTGPTGSGKTTTLYSALSHINSAAVKIVTVEDPVEYQIAGVTQMAVNRKAGFTFAAALRSILRHDPDIIMVGEMRDAETAEIAIQAALTGHLVFSTLHTNDATGGITRLIDMGVEPYLVAATVQGILAQRLVRVVCRDCRGIGTSGHRDSASGAAVPSPDAPMPRCPGCAGAGYKGRSGIYELLTISESIRRMVVDRAPLDAMRETARSEGMRTLRDDGMDKVRAGVTTLEEVLRVTGEDAESDP